LLLQNRKEAVEGGSSAFSERMAWIFWKKAMLNRKLMNTGSASLKKWVVNTFMKEWSKNRSDLKFPARSFNQQWKDRKKDR
jgi:L-lactate dehydrogenase complex protein LldF